MTQILYIDFNKVHFIVVEASDKSPEFTVKIADAITLNPIKERSFKQLKNAMRHAKNIYDYYKNCKATPHN